MLLILAKNIKVCAGKADKKKMKKRKKKQMKLTAEEEAKQNEEKVIRLVLTLFDLFLSYYAFVNLWNKFCLWIKYYPTMKNIKLADICTQR